MTIRAGVQVLTHKEHLLLILQIPECLDVFVGFENPHSTSVGGGNAPIVARQPPRKPTKK